MTIDERLAAKATGFLYYRLAERRKFSKSVEMEWAKEMRNGERGWMV